MRHEIGSKNARANLNPAIMIVAGAIVLALVGCGDSEPSAGDVAIVVSPATVRDIVEETVDGSPDPEVECIRRSVCELDYTVPEPDGPDGSRELFEEQRVVWAALFSDPEFENGVINLHVPVTDDNGKESTEEMRVRCERDMANKVDWETVDADRIYDLCIWQETVPF